MLFVSDAGFGNYVVCDSDDFTHQTVDINTLRYYVNELGLHIQGVEPDGTIRVPVHIQTEQVLRYKAISGADIRVSTSLNLLGVFASIPLHLRLDNLVRGITTDAVVKGDLYLTWDDKLILDFVKKVVILSNSTITIDLQGCSNSVLIQNLYTSNAYGSGLYLINDMDINRAVRYFRTIINAKGLSVLAHLDITKLSKDIIDYLVSDKNMSDMYSKFGNESTLLRNNDVLFSNMNKSRLMLLYNRKDHLGVLRACSYTGLSRNLSLWIDFCNEYAPSDKRFSVLAKDLCDTIFKKEVKLAN